MSEFDPENRLSEEESWELFGRLFPGGLEAPSLLRELAPEGWQNSPLRACFHPAPEQIFRENVRLHENLKNMPFRKEEEGNQELPAPPSLEEIKRDHRDLPGNPARECADLMGQCLWDVFSDNHEVIHSDGRIVDIGSFRGAAGFITAFRKGKRPEPLDLSTLDFSDIEGLMANMDYMEFYMGTIWSSGRADLTPVYELIFRRLREQGLDWRYVFSRLHLVDLAPETGEPDPEKGENWEDYDPSSSFQKEQESDERRRKLEEMRRDLNEAHREAIEQARQNPPPKTVLAYRNVYGTWPQGWPPSDPGPEPDEETCEPI